MLPPLGDDLRAQTGAVAVIPVALGLLGAAAGIWTLARGERRWGWGNRRRDPRHRARAGGGKGKHEPPRGSVCVVELAAATLRWATPLIFAAIGGLLGAERDCQHRARG